MGHRFPIAPPSAALALVSFAVLGPPPSAAAGQTAPVEGLRDNTPAVHAFENARIVVAPGRVLERATLVFRDGVVEAVGADVEAPPDARLWDMEGRTLYPGFLDAYGHTGMPADPPDEDGEERGAVHWNPQVRASTDAAAELVPDPERAGELRSQGFTVAMAVPRLGLFRGATAAVSLGDGRASDQVLRSGVAQAATLWRDPTLGFGYPTSAMGAVVFVRQTLLDAEWYERARAAWEGSPEGLRRPETNRALAALGGAARGEQPLVIETRDENEFLRAVRLADEFPVSLWVRGNGFEYRILDRVRGAGVPLILPVDFPERPSVERPADALGLSLEELRHWHLAPENPGRLAAAGVEFSLTSHGLDEAGDFLGNVRAAVARGLEPEAALAALTARPATLLGLERTHGSLEPGKAANLVVADGDVFEEGTAVLEVWVDGRRFPVDPQPEVDLRGRWRVVAADSPALDGELVLEGRPGSLSGTFSARGEEVALRSASVADGSRRLEVSFPGGPLGREGLVRLSGSVLGDGVHGFGELPGGERLNWRGERLEPVTADGDGQGNGPSADAGEATGPPPPYDFAELPPALEYGRTAPPEQPEHVLVRNATVWTMGPEGILEDADLLVSRGRVARVGRGLEAPAGATVVDAGGRHVTPGLIDAHLHSGVSGGVNEVGSAIVPEVRIGDALTANNIWMYRQLAGGLTTAHVMHGSANPIGGQNAFVKLRWGAPPDGLLLEDAPRTVKFALGENVKRRTDRYPDTRMGTEQIIRDHFAAARDYERAWREWERGGERGIPPRRDLRLDALVDILNGEISIQSHSYRQDEILMLMRLAEAFDVTIDAFHHGVEAYKVAPELAAHGAGAVVWTDWSSFKIEAYDATTYNVKVLMDAGVVTSLHSDNSQIAARMNWEAAKMLRTGVGEEDALALVTRNTATLLGIEDRVGSLEPGKDGDFVIWSGHPLSTFSRPDETWVEGRKYFDLAEDARLREEVERERARLIQLVLEPTREKGEGR